RIKHFLGSDAFAATHFDHFLGGNKNVVYLLIQVEGFHSALQAFSDFTFESRIRVYDVPTLGHELCASGYSEITEYPVQSHSKHVIHETQIKAEEENSHYHDYGRAHDFRTARPGDLLHLTPNIEVKLPCVLYPIFNFFCRIH